MKKTLILFLAGALMACASLSVSAPDWISTGPAFEPNKGAVDLYSNKEDIKRPYDNLGMIRIFNVKRNRADIRAALNKMQKFAASKGADGVLVLQNYDETSKTDSMLLVGYAVKYLDNLTESDMEAIKEFNLMGVMDEYEHSYR